MVFNTINQLEMSNRLKMKKQEEELKKKYNVFRQSSKEIDSNVYKTEQSNQLRYRDFPVGSSRKKIFKRGLTLENNFLEKSEEKC